MSKTAKITYCGVPMECAYEYYREEPQTWTEPGNPAYAALESCLVGGVDIADMLTSGQVTAIEEMIVEKYQEQDYE